MENEFQYENEYQQFLVCIYIVYHSLGRVFFFFPSSYQYNKEPKGEKNHSRSQWLRNASIILTLC